MLYDNKKNMNKFKEIDKIIDNIDSFEKYTFNTKDNKQNQLFSKDPPPFELVNDIIIELTNKPLDNNIYYEFTIKNLVNKKILTKIDKYIEELKKYYLKCKHSKYLENLNEKKFVTIIRQILRSHDYIINSIEKYNNGEKFLLYIIEKKKTNGTLKKINSVMEFD
jgi:hypothetical protein